MEPSLNPDSKAWSSSRFQGGSPNLEAAAVSTLKLIGQSLGTNLASTKGASLVILDTGQTVLHLGASLGFDRFVQGLIVHEIRLDQSDVNGYTALHFAALYGHLDCAYLLVCGGADADIVNIDGHTAFEIALDSNHETVAQLLNARTEAVSAVKDSGSERGAMKTTYVKTS